MKKFKMGLSALALIGASLVSTGCGKAKKVTIYTSTEDYNVEFLQKSLEEKFPDYEIVIENSMSTSQIAAKVIEEGEQSDCDIVYAEEYGYLEKMIAEGVLESIEGDYDLTRYTDDTVTDRTNKYVVPAIRSGGGVVVNTKVLADRGIPEPTSYADLLNPVYDNGEESGLISMASPKSSGTGYMFLYSLVKAWGETEALSYFDSLTPNVLSYTKSGSGPVNALVQEEVAVGFGMISQAVNKINEGNKDLKILFFEEGAPCNLYGTSLVKGHKANKAAKEVLDYIDSTFNDATCAKYYPEVILKGAQYNVENFPENIQYSNMEGNNLEAKEALLAKWTH